MTTYRQISFESPYDLGDNTLFDHDPDSWVNGFKTFITTDLLLVYYPIPDFTTTDGIYLATVPLGDALAPFSGLQQRPYTLRVDEQAREVFGVEESILPALICFDVIGVEGIDDFAHRENTPGLFISEPAWMVLQRFNLGNYEEDPALL